MRGSIDSTFCGLCALRGGLRASAGGYLACASALLASRLLLLQSQLDEARGRVDGLCLVGPWREGVAVGHPYPPAACALKKLTNPGVP
jgi:hypothetical protein